jgi:enoyl-CoA hydratase
MARRCCAPRDDDSFQESVAMIEREQRGTTTIVRMVRGRGNALDLEFCRALAQTFELLARDDCRAVVLTGEGRMFGAGVDLRAMSDGGADYIREFLPTMLGMFRQLATLPKPLVAAVNGHAIAGGGIMALACDQRIMARGTGRFGLTEIVVGVAFPAWALEVARFAIPAEQLSTVICTGRTWLPEESLARGLVDELAEPDQLLERACEVAGELGAFSPAAYAANKRALRAPMVERADAVARATDQGLIDSWCTPESLAQIKEFVSRTIKKG